MLPQLVQQQQSALSATITEWELPDSLRGEHDPKRIGLRVLTSEQELMAAKLGRHEFTRQQYAAVKLAIATFDGQPVTSGSKQVESFWEHAHPKVRSLLLAAYNKLSSPTSEEEEGFFKSESVGV